MTRCISAYTVPDPFSWIISERFKIDGSDDDMLTAIMIMVTRVKTLWICTVAMGWMRTVV